MAALGTIFAPDIPFNEGLLQPVEVRAPEGSLVNATKPAPISGATVYAAWFGTDAILEAANYLLADVGELALRRTGPWGCWTFAWLQSLNQHGEPWFWNVFTGGSGGGGALPGQDGANAILGIQTIDSFTPNIEEYEQQSPALFLERSFAKDSGGAGRFRGGLALQSFCVPYDVEGWDVVVFHNRLTAPSSAVSGGYPGSGSTIRFARDVRRDIERHWARMEPSPLKSYREGAEQPPTRAQGLWVDRSDGYYMRATGGPGLGDPVDRKEEAVEADVRDHFVSREMARTAYGVVLDEVTGRVIEEETSSLRERVRQERGMLPLGMDVLPGRPDDLSDPGAVERGRETVLGEYLGIDAEGEYRCLRCGYRFCSNALNWKWFAKCDDRVVNSQVILNSILERKQGDLMFRRYVCPGCATQIDTEVALSGEPPRWNFRPLALVQRQSRQFDPCDWLSLPSSASSALRCASSLRSTPRGFGHGPVFAARDQPKRTVSGADGGHRSIRPSSSAPTGQRSGVGGRTGIQQGISS